MLPLRVLLADKALARIIRKTPAKAAHLRALAEEIAAWLPGGLKSTRPRPIANSFNPNTNRHELATDLHEKCGPTDTMSMA